MRIAGCGYISGVVASFVLLASANSAIAAGLVVPLNRSELMVMPEKIAEVVVTNPAIADVVAHGATRVSVFGKSVGITNMRVFDEQNNLMKDLEVRVTYDLPAIRKALANFFPNEEIGVEMVNDNIALTGSVSDATIARQATRIATEFVNQARGVEPAEEEKIINLMQIRSGQQVMLRVRIGEIQRSSLKSLGVSLSALRDAGSIGFVLGSGAISPEAFAALGTTFTSTNTSLSALLDVLEADGLFKVMAEPNLVAISGEKAQFLAGGEFPIPIAQDNDSITVEFKQFGVAVEFTPQVLAANRIHLLVQPEVTELSATGAVEIQGLSIPSLSTRRVRTTVELAPGESFMIAGLIRDQLNTTINEIPGIGEIPVLSALFRSTSYQRNETELVMAVTPYMVDPLPSSELRLPGDNYRSASVMEMVFYGALGSLSGDELRISQTPSLEGPIGFMMD